MPAQQLALFGGELPWRPLGWTASDDRVRGGRSRSYLQASAFEPIARFYGELDIKTLGGAGFASQRTTDDDTIWDLSEYAGIELAVVSADEKRYTFTIKDETLPPDPDTGREQSTVSYEYDFTVPLREDCEGSADTLIFIPWSAFNATFRGREKKDAPGLKLDSVRRFSLLMRSFFGGQEGSFSLSIRSITAVSKGRKGGDEDTFPGKGRSDYVATFEKRDGQNRDAESEANSGRSFARGPSVSRFIQDRPAVFAIGLLAVGCLLYFRYT